MSRKRIEARKKKPGERKSVNCCSLQMSAAWTTFRNCSRIPSLNSWKMVWMRSWKKTLDTAGTHKNTSKVDFGYLTCLLWRYHII